LKIAERFEKLAGYQKIELVLLVVFFYGAIIYYYENNLSEHISYEPTPSKLGDEIDIKDKLKKVSNSEAILFLENKLANFQLKKSTLKSQKEQISLDIEGDFGSVINFINTIESHMEILSFELQTQENLLKANIILKKTFLYNSSDSIKNLSLNINPFYKKEQVNPTKNPVQKPFLPPKIVLEAIVLDEVIYKGNWYGLGDLIEGNKIIEIKNDSITLMNIKAQKTFTARLSDG
jgi:hypothetical protein